ncbi:uncharacterized protein TRIADDRAFT_55795 [Trichoplax adhaerens]|uniref:Vitellinogen open beta-sheet domain-containing protein n=1 Tax=Trichoplax adhaerens TaxID=10228 RepID=B3RVV9_TRIAD|nr:hypothetical protein TRIADDRAFT_55795 [Trichoplax adhaerens]EDV26064.1 hypothetical protein TRIADDRAFT_55795 [Trichoplax adhaerens]|eukprot:XP_002112097.1 hypothetical protein TRIADDRAFT_55795 [Trichoplax adhaerens]
MLGLKAIANAGLPATIRALVKCMLISFLADLYEDKTNAIELRIAAFVMVMETNCLESDLRRIELTLRNESNSYVGSFLHSYLQSLAKSKSQSAHRRIALAKYALNFTKKFNSNQQSSKGFHHAIYSTAWKVGLSLNSQLIYESDSKIPRVIKANFNFELFGRRINGFEFGVRIQNLDSILIDILQRHQNRYLPLVNHEQNNEILYGRQDETSKAKLCSKVAEPKLSSYSVVYGREIQFQHFNQDQIKGLMTGLLSNQGININIDQIPTSFSCHVQLVTGLGFPLKIYQDGMTVSSLRISTAYNVLKQKMSLRTTPSIDTHIQSKVFIDATIFQTGFQMNNYLSNHMDVSTLIQPDNFGKMHISFRFPQSKSKKSQDIPFDLSTNLDSFYTQSADSRRLGTTYICIINGKASSEENNCLFIPVLCPLSYSAKMVGSSPILGPTRTKLAMRALNELGVNLDFSVKCHPVQRYCNIFLRTTSQSKPISQILHTFEANIKLDASTQDQLDVTLTFPNSSVGAQRMRLTLPMHMDPLSLRLPPLKPGCFARNWTDWTNCSTSRPCSRGVRSRFQTISCNNNIASCQPRVEEMSCMNCVFKRDQKNVMFIEAFIPTNEVITFVKASKKYLNVRLAVYLQPPKKQQFKCCARQEEATNTPKLQITAILFDVDAINPFDSPILD